MNKRKINALFLCHVEMEVSKLSCSACRIAVRLGKVYKINIYWPDWECLAGLGAQLATVS